MDAFSLIIIFYDLIFLILWGGGGGGAGGHEKGGYSSLVERRTGMPPTQVPFPCAQGIFLLESTFSADSLTVSVRQCVQSHVLTSVCTLKTL